MNGDHFSSHGDLPLPRKLRKRTIVGRMIAAARARKERRQRRDDAVKALRQAVHCLRLEVPESIANDVQKKAEAVIAELPKE